MSNEEMIAAIKTCAEKLGRAPTTRELSLATEGRLPRSLVSRRVWHLHTRSAGVWAGAA